MSCFTSLSPNLAFPHAKWGSLFLGGREHDSEVLSA